MNTSPFDIAPAIYADRLVVRACSTLVNAVRDELMKEPPYHMGEAVDFVRNFANEWEPQPDSVVCGMFHSQGDYGLIYNYDDRSIQMLDMVDPLGLDRTP